MNSKDLGQSMSLYKRPYKVTDIFLLHFRDPGALSALAVSGEDKENMPRTTHPTAPLSQTNLIQLLANTNSDIIPSSGSKTNDIIPSNSNDVVPLSSAVQSMTPHRTGQLEDCPVSPIFPPSPHPLLHGAEKDPENISNSPPPSFLAAAHHAGECDLTDHSDLKLTQVEHQLTQEDHSDRKPTQEHNNTSSSEQRPASNSPVYEQEAPVIEHSVTATEKHNEGSCVLGKRKSSERDPHSSDDGYCTCGSSCNSTPSSSAAQALAGAAVATTTNCICRNKTKRMEYQPIEPRLSSEGTCNGDTIVSGGREKEVEHVGTTMDVCRPTTDGSNTYVNEILDDFDRIFESPEAIAAVQREERPSTATPPPTPAVASGDYRQAEPLPSSACVTPQLPRLVEAKPVPLVADSMVSSSTGDVKMPDIELEVGVAKREDEELKKAMEESLKQQVSINVESLQCPCLDII